MKIAVAILAGLVWGALGAFVNYRINLAALKKPDSKAVLAAGLARMGVDLAVLGAVFLLRGVLPFPFEPALLAAGITLSLGAVALAFLLAKRR